MVLRHLSDKRIIYTEKFQELRKQNETDETKITQRIKKKNNRNT